MHKTLCIDCQANSRRKYSPLCQKCFDNEMKIRTKQDNYHDIRVDVQEHKFF